MRPRQVAILISLALLIAAAEPGLAVQPHTLTANAAHGRTAHIPAGNNSVVVQAASAPRPPDGARDVSLTTARLGWSPGTGALSHDVYVGTSSPPRFRANQPGTEVDLGSLELATTYYWRVDEVTRDGKTPGPVWSFSTAGTVRITLVGDSTVTDELGWGRGFTATLTSHATALNLARNGRSSKSYIDEGLWRTALQHAADYILIQFGHNDMPGKGPERETDPLTTYRGYLGRYIDDARAAGAVPVLVTPLTRRLYTARGAIASDLGSYADAAKAVAAAKGAPVIDLHAMSIDLLDRAGPGTGAAYGIIRDDGSLDRTHLSPSGSQVFGRLVAEELRRAVPALASYISGPAGEPRPKGPPHGAIPWNRCLDQPDAWYASADAVRMADTVLLYQRASGGWPKNTDMARPLDPAERAAVEASRPDTDSTIDNGATTTQLRFLARVFTAAGQARFREAFFAGFDYLIRAQYPNGGWPQYFPLRRDYSRRITFNDDAMVNVLEVMRDARDGRAPLAFVDPDRRSRAATAIARGVDVILASQIRVAGELTAWCAQVDEVTLEPRIARTYEHPSISGKESVGIVRFLMSIPHPDPKVVAAVEAAVAWYRKAATTGIRVIDQPNPAVSGGRDRVVVNDPAAPPLWARFYEIGTNRPIFSGRDSVVRYTLADIEHERRVNYSWLGPYAAELLADDYHRWKSGR
jgi:PelA/Pel-15E family pectate lyase